MTRTLAGRVARAMVVAATLAATATAAVSNGLAWRWSLAREDTRLEAAAATLARELVGADPRAEADDENEELRPSAIHVALYEQGRFVGGAAELPLSRGGCDVIDAGGLALRRCVASHGRWTIVTASPWAPLAATRRTWTVASALAVALAALASGLAGRAAARRVVSPLDRLRAAVKDVRADAPDAAVLGVADGYVEVDALRAALAELLARHAEALARARRFAADAAHELRTPLGTMRAELELAMESRDLPAEAAASLTRARATSLAMGALAERLLILAAPLDGGVGDEAVALADIATGAVDALDAPRAARVRVRFDDEGLVRGDAALLRALVDNALDNALKFAPRGTVIVAVNREAGRVALRIADEGPGVPAASREAVFAPFHRAAEARASGTAGHGVGLALIAHIARAHGGAARFEDAPRGATLCVELPGWHAPRAES